MAGTKGQTRKTYVLPDLVSIKNAQVITDPNEARKLAPVSGAGRPAAERTDTMQELDALCKALHEAWVKAGKPAEFSASPLGKIHVPPDQVDGLKFLIRKSAEFNDCGLQFGNAGVRDKSGRIVVSFRCPDKRSRKPKAGSNGQA
jgi:hypothetical protein